MRRTLVAAGLLFTACEATPPPAPLHEPAPRATPRPERVLRGSVADALTGEPVPGARVALVGTLRATETDDDGAFALAAPDGFTQLRITAADYIDAEAPAGAPLALWPTVADDTLVAERLAARPRRDGDDPTDPDLTEAARDWLLGVPPPCEARPGSGCLPQPGGGSEPGVLRQFLAAPPATVRVYRRGPEDNSCRGRVDVIPLEEYVRGVLPHEWIPSWEMESLKAGAIAARTYAWNWIVRGGKYDCADVDDTTRSQVYDEGRNARCDEAIAATAGQGIRRGDDLVSSEYSAENGNPTEFGVDEPLCAGRARQGHGRGMCQWGTQRWAQQRGQNYVWMVEHYYPGATVSRPEPPAPRLELSQGLARTEPQPCADPEGTYQCADFVPDGRSRGLFDVYVGQGVELTVRVRNAGDGATAGAQDAVLLAIDLPEGLLAADAVRIEGQGGDDRNPPADTPAGPQLRLRLHAIGPGETRTVVVRLRGAGYSVPTGGPARVRTWIQSIAERYDKPAWDQPPARNEGQQFNGGDLKMLTEFDVFEPARWTWDGGDPALVEGWRARGAAPLTVENGAVRLEPQGDDPGMESPFTRIDASALGTLTVLADRPAGGRFYWRAPGEGFTEERSLPLTFGAALRLAGAPGWTGAVEQIRLDVDDGAGPVLVNEVVVDPFVPPAPDPDAAVVPPDPDADAPPGPDAEAPRPDADVPLADGGSDEGDARVLPPLERRVLEVSYSGGCTAAPAPLAPLALLALLALRRRR